MTDQEILVARAQANADFFGWPYVIFTDTAGQNRIERYDQALTCHRQGAVVYPNPDRSVKNVTA
jgi:hypothetical protein